MKNAFDIINKLYMSFDQKASIDLVKYPLLTEKTIKLIEQNQYSFAVSSNATKTSVKVAIEQLFDVFFGIEERRPIWLGSSLL